MIVVAVDIRWVTKCLNEVYKVALEYDEEQDAASAYDYLEKIFQITYQVGHISEEDSKDYLRQLFKTQEEKKPVQPKPKTELNNGGLNASRRRPLGFRYQGLADSAEHR